MFQKPTSVDFVHKIPMSNDKHNLSVKIYEKLSNLSSHDDITRAKTMARTVVSQSYKLDSIPLKWPNHLII